MIRLKKALLIISLLGMVTFNANFAQESKFTIQFNGGYSFLPMVQWSQAWNFLSNIKKSNPNFNGSVFLNYNISGQHFLNIGIEFIESNWQPFINQWDYEVPS